MKMARLTKDGSSRGQKSPAESVSKPPAKTLIIPSKELVQVIAKVLQYLCSVLISDFNLLHIF